MELKGLEEWEKNIIFQVILTITTSITLLLIVLLVFKFEDTSKVVLSVRLSPI